MIWWGAFSTLLQLWAPDMPGSNVHGEIILRFLLTMATGAHWSLSVSRLTTLQGRLSHSSRRKLQLWWSNCPGNRAFSLRPQLLLCSFWVRSCLDSGNWGLRETGSEGDSGTWAKLVADMCKLELSAGPAGNKKYESQGKGMNHIHKDSLKFRPGGEL